MNFKLELATGEKNALDASAERAIKPLKQLFIDIEDGIDRPLLEANLRAIAKPSHKIYCGQLLERIDHYRKGMVNRSQDLSARVAYAKQLEQKMFLESEVGTLEGFRTTDINRILEIGIGTDMDDELVIKMVEVRGKAFEQLYFAALNEAALRAFKPKDSVSKSNQASQQSLAASGEATK